MDLLGIADNVRNILEKRIINLEKQLTKNEQDGRRSNVKISNKIPD